MWLSWLMKTLVAKKTSREGLSDKAIVIRTESGREFMPFGVEFRDDAVVLYEAGAEFLDGYRRAKIEE